MREQVRTVKVHGDKASPSAWARLSPGRAAAAIFFLALLAGCQQYNWRFDYAKAEEDARQANKYLFVFYKWWLDNDSNRMLSNEVLSDPQVVAEFQDTVNVLIERASGSAYVEYMRKFGVDGFPAAVIVAPDGRYQLRLGFVPKDRFLEFVRQAKGAGGARSPAGKAAEATQP
jgi:hypothetical protein